MHRGPTQPLSGVTGRVRAWRQSLGHLQPNQRFEQRTAHHWASDSRRRGAERASISYCHRSGREHQQCRRLLHDVRWRFSIAVPATWGAEAFTTRAGEKPWIGAAGAHQFMALPPLPNRSRARVGTWDQLLRKLGLEGSQLRPRAVELIDACEVIKEIATNADRERERVYERAARGQRLLLLVRRRGSKVGEQKLFDKANYAGSFNGRDLVPIGMHRVITDLWHSSKHRLSSAGH